MTTQLLLASTAYGLATVAAARRDNLLPPADRRILVVAHNAAVPEASPDLLQVFGAERLLDGFDAVHSYNGAVAPAHPSAWRPRAEDEPLWQRYLRMCWGIPPDEPVDLVCESIQVEPARAVARLFPDAAITVYADGLMSYGPTRNPLPDSVGARLQGLLYPDLIPGLRPLLLSEWEVPTRVISATALRTALSRLDHAPTVVTHAARGTVGLVVGQYLAALGVVSAAEEARLQQAMIEAAAAAGFRRVVVKGHPSAPGVTPALAAHGRGLGVEVWPYADPGLVEPWFAHPGVGLVVGCFSTALATAAHLYGLPVRSIGAEFVADRLLPVANSNRIPLVLAHHLYAGAPGARSPEQTARLVRAVSYCMQPQRMSGLREDAAALTAEEPAALSVYVPLSRRIALGLSGPRWLHRLLRRMPLRARRRLARWWTRIGLNALDRPGLLRSSAPQRVHSS